LPDEIETATGGLTCQRPSGAATIRTAALCAQLSAPNVAAWHVHRHLPAGVRVTVCTSSVPSTSATTLPDLSASRTLTRPASSNSPALVSTMLDVATGLPVRVADPGGQRAVAVVPLRQQPGHGCVGRFPRLVCRFPLVRGAQELGVGAPVSD
jgi:hypothetical protein